MYFHTKNFPIHWGVSLLIHVNNDVCFIIRNRALPKRSGNVNSVKSSGHSRYFMMTKQKVYSKMADYVLLKQAGHPMFRC